METIAHILFEAACLGADVFERVQNEVFELSQEELERYKVKG